MNILKIERGDSQMIIRKAEHKRDYTCVSNEILQRKDMSMRAKGLLVYLLSLPADWELHKTELPKHFTDGRDAVFRAFEELEKLGYIQGKKFREKGRIQYQYTVYEEPIKPQHYPERNYRYGKTDTVFQEVINNYKQNIHKEEKKDFLKKEEKQKQEESTEEEIKKLEEKIATAPKWLKKYLISIKEKKEVQKQQ